ncbi:polysulfide reductase NrfD [Sphaerisporangium flaviroseum]|uniref:Polysulfide reductase NrfD n=1 Tax=Sphaerisporangium flaviroseum TaxID=509199 RepID=A0ABP7IFD4_9ACTN
MARERAMVPEAEFSSYYGRPVIKAPIWHEPHMPLYLYLGGVSGACALSAALEELQPRPHGRLGTLARLGAALGAVLGTGFLIAELGRPERFLNMMRVFKPTSPMSMGSWLLAAQGGLSTMAAASAVTGVLPGAGRAAALSLGVTGPLMATYTAVLIADTAVPAWHEARHELPFLFGGSAMAGAGALGMLATLARPEEAAPVRRMAVFGAALETAAGAVMERRLGLVAEPYRREPLMRAARLLAVGGGALAALSALPSRRGGGRVLGPALAAAAAAALTAGALCTRFGVLRAGRASAEDPAYTIIPQRQRLTAAGRGTEGGSAQ